MVEKPLKNRTIAITRARAQAEEFSALLTALGARVLQIPVIQITPLASRELDDALQSVNGYSWIVFTSANGAGIFLEKLSRLTPPAELKPSVCAIGPGTASRIEQMGYRVDLVPKLFQAEGLIESFSNRTEAISPELPVLIPRALQARSILPETLEKMGFRVNLVPVYKTDFPADEAPALRKMLKESTPDMITFTSSSTVINFLKLAGKEIDLAGYRFASIGPITTDTAARAGLHIDVQPAVSTLESMARSIADYFANNPGGKPSGKDNNQ